MTGVGEQGYRAAAMKMKAARISRSSSCVALFTLLLLAAGSASAKDKGFEIMLRPAYGSAGSKSPVTKEDNIPASAITPSPGQVFNGDASPYGGGFVGELSAGYRFLPFLSAGVAGGIRSASASTVDDGTTDLKRSAFTVGPYVRAYFFMVPVVEPWISIGVAYMSDEQTYKRANVDWSLQHHGVAVPITVGVDYPIIDMLAIGPSFQYTTVAQAGGCLKGSAGGTSVSECTDAKIKIPKTDNYSVWSIGLNLRLTL